MYVLNFPLVRCTRNPPLYFAEVLDDALGGISADSKDIARVVISRSEVSGNRVKKSVKPNSRKITGKVL